MSIDPREPYDDLISAVAGAGDTVLVLVDPGLGRADVHAIRGRWLIEVVRWPCWPACTTSEQPIRGSAICWRAVEGSSLTQRL